MPNQFITTELEAVNYLLALIEEAPANTLLGTITDPDILDAQFFLAQAGRRVQSRDWDFCSEDNYSLAVDVNGEVRVPSEITAFVTDDVRTSIRGGRLFDRDNQTFRFTQTPTGRARFNYSFEDLPDYAAQHVVDIAALAFHAKAGGDPILIRELTDNRNMSYLELFREDARAIGGSITGPDAIANR